jgi:maleate isomerase
MKNSTRRFGVLFPPGNVAMELELHSRLPTGVAMHCNRLSRPNSILSESSLREMEQSLGRAARDLAQTYPEVIIYGCTSGSFIAGADSDTAIADKIEMLTHIPAITTSTAVRKALHAVGATRVFMVTPYPDTINRQEAQFLSYHGVTVAGWDTFDCRTSEEIREVDSTEVKAMVLEHREDIARCDGVFVSCTQLFTMDQIADIEAEIDCPVVSSNQACLWAALRHMKVASRGLGAGRLLEEF